MSSLVPPAPQLLAFVAVAGLLTITPGADMALVMRHAFGGGTRPAFLASLGIGLGCLIWGAASALGVAVIFAHSYLAFAVLKYAGGAYLVYLGGLALHAAVRAQSRVEVATAATSAKAVNAFAQGLLTNLTNPKVAVFYVTFLPQFIVPDRNVLTQSVVLAATHVAMGLLWLTLYARFIDRMAAVLLTDRVKRRMEAATGAVLMALGIRLALARR
jgi:RhtB (resistance to homoserine/threonine) family protein